MKEKQGKYDEALQCLQAVGKLPQALKKALDFRQRGIVVAYTGLTVEDLAYKTAKHHENRQELKLMKECIDLLPDVDDKVRLFKRARLYREAVSLLVSENLLEDAFRIQAAQKQYDGGVKLAASKGHGRQVLSFLLMKARALPVVRQAIREICAFQREFDPSEGAPDLSRLKGDLATDLLPILGEMQIADKKYNLTTECPLLCMEMTMLDCICNLNADIMYKQDFSPNVFGRIEQMRIWLGLELAKTSSTASFPRDRDDLKIVLQQCEDVVECFCQLSQIGDVATDVSDVTSSLLDWYCIQKDVNSVVMPKEQDVWVSFGECVIPNAVTDEGAMKLDSSRVIRELKLHLYHSLQCWLIICKKAVEAQFAQPSFDAYHRVVSDWTTGQLLEPGTMKDFLRTCCVLVYFDVVSSKSVLIAALLRHSNLNTVIEDMPDKLLNALVGKLLRTNIDAPERKKKVKRKVNELLAEKDFDRLFDSFPVMYSGAGEKAKRLLISYLSPETSVYIPLSKMHLDLLEKYPEVKQELLSLYLPSVHRDVNTFMSAWWMKGTSEVQKRLMQTAANDDYHINDMDKKIHCFALWSKACGLFHLPNPRPLVFCKILLDRLFSVVITRKSLKKFNAINALVVLELLASVLIAMLSCQETCLKGNASVFPRCVPHLYAHIVQLFDDSRPRRVRGRLVRLMETVYKSVHHDRNVQGMENEARRFLIEVIDLILGKRFRNFNILKHIITGKNNVKNGTLQRCVILLITLLGNLEFFSPAECQRYRYELVGVLQSAIPQNMDQESAAPVLKLCDHLHRAVQTATCTTELFYFASQLCNYGDKRLAVIENDEAYWTMHFRPVHLTEVHNVPFPAIPYNVPTTVMTLAQQTAYSPPMVQSATGETAWPDWSEEGQVTQPSNVQGSAPFEGFVPVPTEMSFTPGLSQPTEDVFNTSYEYEEEENPSGFDIEEQLPDISAEKEFIKRGWCLVCGFQVVSEQRTDQNPDLTGEAGDASAASHCIQQHIQSRVHIDNVNGYKSFEELKNSIQQTLPSMTAILQHAKAMENDRRIDGLSDKLKKAHKKLQDVMTLNIGQQQGSHAFWTGKRSLMQTESEKVQKLASDLKKLLPEVEPPAMSQVHKDSADEEEDGLVELDEQAIRAAEESHARKGKKSKKKRQ